MLTQVAIATMKPLSTIKELKSFLGKVSYIIRFIPGLALITPSFIKLLNKGHDFMWGSEQKKAFHKLQQIMMNLPTVQAPVRRKPLLIYLASSPLAIGPLIAQEEGGGIE